MTYKTIKWCGVRLAAGGRIEKKNTIYFRPRSYYLVIYSAGLVYTTRDNYIG
jgi:hypothetical protein